MFKVVKTQYHSGRIRISFVPGGLNTDDALSVDLNKCYSQVYDLREKSEFEFEVPYVYNAPWCPLRTTMESVPFTKSDAVGFNLGTGYLIVTILNQLRAPGVTANSIDFIVEISGGSDYAVAIPSCPIANPLTATPPTQQNPRVAEVQGLWTVPERDSVVESTAISLFEKPSSSENFIPEELTIGEKIVSIRQLLKRFQFTTLIGTAATTNVTIDPYALIGTAIGGEAAYNQSDYYTYFSFLFAYMRGGMRLKISAPGTTNNGVVATLRPLSANGNLVSTGGPAGFYEKLNYGKCLLIKQLEGVFEIEVPNYRNVPIVMSRPFSFSAALRDPMTVHGCQVHFDALEANSRLYRAVSDDFSFGYLRGAPLVNAVATF